MKVLTVSLFMALPIGLYLFFGPISLGKVFFRSCPQKPHDQITVKLMGKVGGYADSFRGQKIDMQYYHSVYMGADGCRYIVTEKRVIKYKDSGQEEVFFYSNIEEGDTIRSIVERVEKELPKSDDLAYAQNIESVLNAIHLHHNHLLKRVP